MSSKYLMIRMNEYYFAFDHRRLETSEMNLLQRQIMAQSISTGKSHTRTA